MNRKAFLKTVSVLAAASLSSRVLPANELRRSLPIVDTHQHLVDFNRFGKGWANPPVEGNFGLKEYKTATKRLNVVKAVYMEVAVARENRQREALYALELCEAPSAPTVGAVIAADLYQDNFKAYISQYKDEECIKGVRAGFRSAESILEARIVENVRYLGEMGKRLDFIVPPAWLPNMAKLIQQCPDTWFQADHCVNGDPKAFFKYDRTDVKPVHTSEEWLDGVEQIAARQNVVCKVSGLVSRMSGLPATAENLFPLINHCFDAFGTDRVMFASDWPWCLRGMSLEGWVGVLKEVVESRPVGDQKKLFHDNAVRHYKI